MLEDRLPLWAEDLPRFYDIFSQSDRSNEANYFSGFDDVWRDNPLARKRYKQLENKLRQLDNIARQEFKQKILRYITIKDNRRGYNQLFECLNELNGYLYLKSMGCKEIHFIPEKRNSQTPDLSASFGISKVLLEVKTINKSDLNIKWVRKNSEIGANGVRHMKAKEVRRGLDDSLKHKIKCTISKARSQLLKYSCTGVKRRIVYLVLDLDIRLALDPRNHDELAAYMRQQGDEQIEVVHEFLSLL